jgi:hypothetical protein
MYVNKNNFSFVLKPFQENQNNILQTGEKTMLHIPNLPILFNIDQFVKMYSVKCKMKQIFPVEVRSQSEIHCLRDY